MKKILNILAISLMLFTSCDKRTPEQRKAEKLATEWLKESLKDPDSYKPVSFTNVEKIYGIGEYEQKDYDEKEIERNIHVKAIAFLEKEIKTMKPEYKVEIRVMKGQIKEQERDIAKIDSVLSKYKLMKKIHIGWSLFHEYRAKNSMGGYNKSIIDFSFNNDLTKITDTYRL